MLRSVEQYVFPADLQEAIRVLEQAEGRAAVVAGGTVLTATRPPEVHTLVDIGRLGLSGVATSSDGIRIGACTTLQEMVQPTPLGGYLQGIIPEASFTTASRILRNAATLGGNLVTLQPACHLVTALLVVDALVIIAGPEGVSRSFPLEEFLLRRDDHLAPGRLITAVHLPRPLRFTSAAFEKLAMVHHDPGIATVAVRLTLRNRKASDVRVAVGGICARPARCHATETSLEDREIDEASVATALEAMKGEIHPRSNVRASAEYRGEMALVLASRALHRAFDIATSQM